MFRWRQEPEQGTHNTVSLRCYLCQGNWTGTNTEELRKHLEKDHKVVFKIKELIELSKAEELEPNTDERLLADTRVGKNLGERMSQYSIVGIIISQVNLRRWRS